MLGRSNQKHSQARCQRYLLGFQQEKNINTLPILKRNKILVALETAHEEIILRQFLSVLKKVSVLGWLWMYLSCREPSKICKYESRVLAGRGNLISFLRTEYFSCVHIDGIIWNPK